MSDSKFIAWDGTGTSQIKDATALVHDLFARLRLIAREVDGLGDGAPDDSAATKACLNVESLANLDIPVEPWALKMLDAKR